MYLRITLTSHIVQSKDILPANITRSFASLPTSTNKHKRHYWEISRDVRFPVIKLPPFKLQNSEALLKKGKRIEKGIPLKIFVKILAQHLRTFRRLLRGKYPDYSSIADELYARRLDQYHAWTDEVTVRRSSLRNGKAKNPFVEFGQPNLRGERLRLLLHDLCVIDRERQLAKRKSLMTPRGKHMVAPRKIKQLLGFDRVMERTENTISLENVRLKKEGMKILKRRKSAHQSQSHFLDILSRIS